jgi:dipeptidyl aminopeptidase/acylaminoacyl peptidase
MNRYPTSIPNARRSGIRFLILCAWLLISPGTMAQVSLETPNVESVLYLGKNKKQPLIVGLGGSEGGNAWTSDRWKETRDAFLARGYAFLALGYFGAKGTPSLLNKIAIEDVYRAIKEATRNKQIDGRKIAIIGGSRGADLALLLGSYYEDIDCVVSIVGSNAVFPGHTRHFSTSCWTYQGKELPFVPVNEAAMPHLLMRNLKGAFEAMLTDTASVEKAAIQVENIKGPVLFLSATEDEICPSTAMAEQMSNRLRANNFNHPFEHRSFPGGHTEPLKHFDLVVDFLDKYFLKRK